MNHASGMRAAHAFGADRHLKPIVDLVQFVRTPGSPMRRIRHEPQPAGPDDDGSDPAFAILLAAAVVEDRKVRVDAADLQRPGTTSAAWGSCVSPFPEPSHTSAGDASAIQHRPPTESELRGDDCGLHAISMDHSCEASA
jgi:hypothetical protein